MIKPERIVCPTDLSEDSERTIRYAVAITRASGANLGAMRSEVARLAYVLWQLLKKNQNLDAAPGAMSSVFPSIISRFV